MNRPIAIAIAATLTACASVGNDFSWQDANSIRNGMTREQVIAILGEPNSIEDNAHVMIWSYAHVNMFSGTNSKAVKFLFDDKGITYGIPEGGVAQYQAAHGA